MLVSNKARCRYIEPRLGYRRRAGLLVRRPCDFRWSDWNTTQNVEPVVPTLRAAVGSLYNKNCTRMHNCWLLTAVVLDTHQSLDLQPVAAAAAE